MEFLNTRATIIRRCFLALGILLLLAGSVMAQQETGRITGIVKDQSGAVVPGASVTIRNVATNATRTSVTGDTGAFTVTNLLPGTYEVKVEMTGFNTGTQRVVLPVGGVAEADFSLKVGATSTTVTVSESAIRVDTESPVLATVITTKQIEDLPTLTRNPYDLVGTAGNASPGDPRDGARGAGYNLNGQRSASTNILLDGSDNNDSFTATVGQSVPLDSVQEFSVVSSTFSAEYGRASGGVVNVATKSGTNEFHGSAYEYNRVSKLTSNSFDNNANGIPKSVFARNQFGFSVGGPAIKDKLFFFNNTEWFRVRSNDTRVALVPTPQLIAAAAGPTKDFFAAYGKLKTPINGPIYTKDMIPGLCNTTGPCANLPGSTPVWGTVYYPVPADAGGGDPRNEYQSVSRVDFNLSDKTTIYARYAVQHQDFFVGTNAESPYQGFDSGTTNFNQNALFSITHTFTPSLVSQSKIVFNRLNNLQPLGDNPASPTLYLSTANTRSRILSISVALPGYLPYNPGSAIPFGGPQNLGQIFEDVGWVKGPHTFRFGGSYIYLRDNRAFGAYQEAVEQLGNNLKNGMDGFLTGQLLTFQAAVDPQGKFPGDTITLPVGPPDFTRSNRYHDFAFYAQDNWNLKPGLTLNFGLRWEYYGVQHNKDPYKDSNFYLGPGGTLQDQFRNGSVQLAPNSPKGGLWGKDLNNFAPRLGFAWDIFGTGKTSLRGGYGISYERNFGNVTFNVIQNPPNYAVVVLGPADVGGSLPVYVDNSGPLGGSTGSTVLPITSLRAVNENIKAAYAHFWSATLEHELFSRTVLSLGYSASKGVGLYVLNRQNIPGSGAYYFGDQAANPLSTRVNNQYSDINYRDVGGFSNYHGMIAEVRSQNLFNQGLQMNLNWTWSHSIDNDSSTFNDAWNNFNLGLLDPANPRLDYGNSDFDIRHRVALSAVWSLPYAKNMSGAGAQILDGWSLAPIIYARTGTPYTVYDCTNGVRYCTRLLLVNPSALSLTGPSNPAQVEGVPNSFTFLDLSSQSAGVGTYYDPITGISDFGPFPTNMAGRNIFRQPGLWSFDLGLYKTFRLPKEGTSLQFRAEFYNILNHSNLFVDTGSTDISGMDYVPAFRGNPGTNAERRNIQFALRFMF